MEDLSRAGLDFGSYEELWSWSVTDLAGFWRSIWTHFEVSGTVPAEVTEGGRTQMPGTRWFPATTLNYAQHALRSGSEPAVISVSQTRGQVTLSRSELLEEVRSARGALRDLGVGRGDRVAAYLPNISETVVAFLATSSLGAVWSSCPPEFGTRSVIDRFGQIEPKVLLAVDGYKYGHKTVDRSGAVEEIRKALPSLRATASVAYLGSESAPDCLDWRALTASGARKGHDRAVGDVDHERVPFDHPLYVLYSSGTTGMPKPIVHGHGGILVEHLKALGLHCDLRDGDRFMWFTTTGWMMWNFLVSGLLHGATVVCFDGDPAFPDPMALWSLVDELGLTYFGTSAPYLMSCLRQGLSPRHHFSLESLRTIGSTGAPLPDDGFKWVYESAADDVELSSISGGTDVCTAFVGSTPLHPVRAGRIACRYLGAAVQAYSSSGSPLLGTTGELVVTAPMPSMPVGFWGDVDGSRLRSAYFERYPGVWHHGDWITVFADGSCAISGRSDATLNRGGIRLGTAELYSVVESLSEVDDSLVVHLDESRSGAGPTGGSGAGAAPGGGAGARDELVLFVVLSAPRQLDPTLEQRIRQALRDQLSPRHVPDRIVQVPSVPRTLSGKKLEVPVKRILAGATPDQVASRDSLVDPGALDPFVAMVRARR